MRILSRIIWPISTELETLSPWVKGTQVFTNKRFLISQNWGFSPLYKRYCIIIALCEYCNWLQLFISWAMWPMGLFSHRILFFWMKCSITSTLMGLLREERLFCGFPANCYRNLRDCIFCYWTSKSAKDMFLPHYTFLLTFVVYFKWFELNLNAFTSGCIKWIFVLFLRSMYFPMLKIDIHSKYVRKNTYAFFM